MTWATGTGRVGRKGLRCLSWRHHGWSSLSLKELPSNVRVSCRGWEVFCTMDKSFTIKIISINLRQHKQLNINLKQKTLFLFCSVCSGFKNNILEVSVTMWGEKKCGNKLLWNCQSLQLDFAYLWRLSEPPHTSPGLLVVCGAAERGQIKTNQPIGN